VAAVAGGMAPNFSRMLFSANENPHKTGLDTTRGFPLLGEIKNLEAVAAEFGLRICGGPS
jgi:hypothetical protein